MFEIIITLIIVIPIFIYFRRMPFYQFATMAFVIILVAKFLPDIEFVKMSSFFMMLDMIFGCLGVVGVITEVSKFDKSAMFYILEQRFVYLLPNFMIPESIHQKKNQIIRNINRRDFKAKVE